MNLEQCLSLTEVELNLAEVQFLAIFHMNSQYMYLFITDGLFVPAWACVLPVPKTSFNIQKLGSSALITK